METGGSVGWTWALYPGLAKIHTNEEDLAFSMGHNLEFSDAAGFLNTFAMGVTLAAEQQKLNPSAIRALRTTACGISKAAGISLFSIGFMTVVCSLTGNNPMTALICALICIGLEVFLKFRSMYFGYKKGIAICEKVGNNPDSLVRSAKIAGIFMVGAFAACLGSLSVFRGSDETGMFAAVLGGLGLWLAYDGLTKKKYSLAKTVGILLLVGLTVSLVQALVY